MMIGSLARPAPGWFPDALRLMIGRLADPALRAAPKGRVAVDGDRLFIVINEYDTAPAADLTPETHRLYCDVQVVLDGEEAMGWDLLATSRPLRGDYDPKRDLQLYDGIDGLNWLHARPGTYHLFTPSDVHLPGVALDAPRPVRKAVGKIHRDCIPLA